jgi:hypothetical protein
MIVKSSILFRDYAKINDQEFQFCLSMKISSVHFLIIYEIENFQKSFDLLFLFTTHAIDDHDMNETTCMIISIINDTKHETKIHI